MSEPRPNPVEKLTLPGRLLLIFTVLLAAGGFYWTFFFFAENFPRGHYPLPFMCAPLLIGCFLFFIGLAWILERCGIQIYVKPVPPPPSSAAAPEEPNDRNPVG